MELKIDPNATTLISILIVVFFLFFDDGKFDSGDSAQYRLANKDKKEKRKIARKAKADTLFENVDDVNIRYYFLNAIVTIMLISNKDSNQSIKKACPIENATINKRSPFHKNKQGPELATSTIPGNDDKYKETRDIILSENDFKWYRDKMMTPDGGFTDVNGWHKKTVSRFIVFPVFRMDFSYAEFRCRLASFSTFPRTISILGLTFKLARSGFYYCGDGRSNQVRCFSCHFSIDVDNPTIHPDNLHLQMSPTCPHLCQLYNPPFLNIGSTSGCSLAPRHGLSNAVISVRFPISQIGARQDPTRVQQPGTDGDQGGQLQQDWPSATLGATGGEARCNTSRSDSAASDSLQRITRDQEHESSNRRVVLDQPQGQNQNPSQSQRLTLTLRNRNSDPQNHDSHNTATTFRPHFPGIIRPRDQQYPQFSSRHDRELSYHAYYGRYHFHHSPRMLARAGFFYTGWDDYVLCFFCGGGLRNLEPGDDPWVEHARWFPYCGYLRMNRDDDFINFVQNSTNTKHS